MTAEIIDMWLHRKRGEAVTISPEYRRYAAYDRFKRARDDLREHTARSTHAIMDELMPLRMTGPEDAAAREALYAELQANSDPFNC